MYSLCRLGVLVCTHVSQSLGKEALVKTDEPRTHAPSSASTASGPAEGPPGSAPIGGTQTIRNLERDVEHILDDCFFTVGQAVGMRMTADYEAIVWWRDHFRPKFINAMKSFGNRWLDDRDNVTGVGLMLGERAVRYASGRSSIDLASAREAAADVERYCGIRARRMARGRSDDGRSPIIAGYWCYGEPWP
jgi:hypothetical protein